VKEYGVACRDNFPGCGVPYRSERVSVFCALRRATHNGVISEGAYYGPSPVFPGAFT